MTYLVCVDIEGNEHSAHIDELRWRPSVYGILIKDEMMLLAKQFGKFGLPGGGMEFGESPEDALAREIKEETGITITSSRLQSVQSDLFKLPHSTKGGFIQSIQLFYVCEFIDGELSIEGFDEYEQQDAELAQWLPWADVDNTPMYGSCDFRREIKKSLA